MKKILTRQQKQKTEFRYGITQAKTDKYTQKIEDIDKEYVLSSQKDIELLRHRIKAFTHRSVYQISRYKSIVWKNKGCGSKLHHEPYAHIIPGIYEQKKRESMKFV